jgi:hypothetical protein
MLFPDATTGNCSHLRRMSVTLLGSSTNLDVREASSLDGAAGLLAIFAVGSKLPED